MGRANRALAGRVHAIAGGFLKASGPHGQKIVETGNPVRPDVVNASAVPYKERSAEEPFNLLVFGGSQGASFFGDKVPGAVRRLPKEKLARLRIVQQARAEDEAEVAAAYREAGIEAEVSPFFIDMADRIAKAHLVISRSGASTVSEIAAIGRPAILVPYPHALDHDQAANAEALASVGGADIRSQNTLDEETLAEIIGNAMGDPDRLAAMAGAAKTSGKPDAVHLLADLVEAMASGQSVEQYKRGAGT